MSCYAAEVTIFCTILLSLLVYALKKKWGFVELFDFLLNHRKLIFENLQNIDLKV